MMSSFIGNAVQAVAPTTASRVRWVAQTIASGVRWAAQAIASGVRWVAQAIASGVRWAAQAIASGVRWAAQAIASGVRWVAQTIDNGVRWVAQTIDNGVRWVAQTIDSGVRWVAQTIDSGVRWVAQTIASGVRWVAQTIESGVRWVAQTIASGVRWVAQTIESGVRWVAQTIASGVRWVAQTIANGVRWTAQTMASGVRWVAQTIASGVRWVVYAIVSAIGRSGGAVNRLSLSLRPTTLTLTTDSGFIRAVAFRGNTVIAWNFANLEDAPTSSAAPSVLPDDGNSENLEPEESDLGDSGPGDPDLEGEPDSEDKKPVEPALLRRLIADMPTGRLRLVTGLPIYDALLRHFPLPQKVRKRYLERMIVAEVLDAIPFEENEVDISWRLRREGGTHEALAVAVPKANIDAQVKLAAETGLKPKAAYAKATALTLMAGADDAIVVHLESEHLAVVLVREGVPLVVHQQPFLRLDTSVEAQANALSGAVDQVLGYYLSIGPQDYNNELPVVLTGQLAGLEELVETLPQVLGRQVRTAEPAVDFPNEFPWGEYSANIGLFLADKLRGKTWGKSSKQAGAAVNVLPQRHRPIQAPVVPVISFAALVSLVVLAFSVAGVVQDMQAEAHELSLVREIRLDQEREQRLAANIEQNIASRLVEAQGRELALASSLEELTHRIDTLVYRLNTITGEALPLGVQLTSMVPERVGIALAGNASTYEAILQYASNLRESGLFQSVTVLQAAGSNREALGFTVLASIPEASEDHTKRDISSP